ncbi:class I SAM-dependent methyltransferase [Jatrophihabitans telluris]|uniref:Class I SAM-dependent methyltransferase n=1 Tax=Jatrophihabitans telluris TaxID=2038343 RepID=A0ABY4R1P5_9ACTN|nr:class I SAM-dependent methyltransferase [Jatrophihabitans telluris]UQX89650.1 class I SAM-dependent methyltransferase [Jatrophihabitans telluris]
MKIAEIAQLLTVTDPPLHFSAYDGSSFGPADAQIQLHLHNERGLRYLATAPGDLGLARAYVSGDLTLDGAHPGDPYEALRVLGDWRFRRPTPKEATELVKALGLRNLVPPEPPEQESLPRWRRTVEGLRHSRTRDAEAIHHHYDVSNAFYELVLGPSMAYTCAVFPKPDASLEEAQEEKFDLVARKLGLEPGMTLLDIGCGWGGMVRHAAKHYGVKTLGVTLSAEQAKWARAEIERQGLQNLAEVRHSDYRDAPGENYDAVSSIGLLEHVGVGNYPAYFGFIKDKLRDGGRLLNHCITRPDNKQRALPGYFIDRYVFPDGELTGSGRIIAEAQNAGLEVRHEENLREHYALTLKYWCENLERNWDDCVAEVGEATARVWGLYMAGSRLGFETNGIQLHQVLAVRVADGGNASFPLRPTWLS